MVSDLWRMIAMPASPGTLSPSSSPVGSGRSGASNPFVPIGKLEGRSALGQLHISAELLEKLFEAGAREIVNVRSKICLVQPQRIGTLCP